MAKASSYIYIPHHQTEMRLAGKAALPAMVADQLPKGNGASRFNAWFAVKVTSGVGTMWCAYAFAALAIVSLPAAIGSGRAVVLVSWYPRRFSSWSCCR